MQLVMAALLLGIASTALAVLAVQSLRARDLAMSRLLRHAAREDERARQPQSSLASGRLARWIAPLSRSTADGAAYGPLRARLAEAGYRGRSALAIYMGGRVALAIAVATAALPTAVWLCPPAFWLLAVLSTAAIGFIAPGIFVSTRRRQRRAAIFAALPDAIDLMVVCVEAGLSLAATLQRVAQEFRGSSPVLAGELELVVLETQAGKSLSAALRALGERSGVSDLNSLVSALVQTERLGTRIADTMRVQSESVRVKRLRMAEELAQKAPVKMLFPAVLIFAAMLITAIVPAGIEMLKALSK